ncbi:hypothetical protein MRS76_04865 [Rhizobiaceae bacterium n13]|uniref:Uncharacterized protein n=1 Tax=Ferirhizobium litorale TaxID=2927786 RepID=A0AAE3QDM3_9HYPH|nr:hypothetical protein [Fererhizobium litorale]MDI7861279.1 hypothetical protein [Fererhizobium litorale]MDI7921426.1 hypothetical protein [Fererhizobium litorale]
MAEIVDIGKRLDRSQRPLPPAPPIVAKILWFTGVRYEPIPTPVAKPAVTSAKK